MNFVAILKSLIITSLLCTSNFREETGGNLAPGVFSAFELAGLKDHILSRETVKT